MAQWSISEIAREVGLRTSAIRYYEQIGILLPARRVSGQRAVRRSGALPAGCRTAGAGSWIYTRRDSAVILRLRANHSDIRAMERDSGAENAGVGCQDQTDPKHARASEEAASLLRV